MGHIEGNTDKKPDRQLEAEIQALRYQLSEKNHLEEQLRQAQKMESLANLASGISHDFNNILQTILCYIQLLLIKADKNLSQDIYINIEKTINKGSALAKQLMAFGRRNGSNPLPLDLNWKIREIRSLLERTIPKMVRIDLDLDENLHLIHADGGQIEQVLMNISLNARDAMPEGGILNFRTENIQSSDDPFLRGIHARSGRYVMLSIADTGCGIRDRDMQYIFDPFFTTKKKGEGTGLGLSMVYAIVRNHGGFIDVSSKAGKGTVFRIYFPSGRGDAKQSNIIETRPKRAIATGNESLLLVDDEPAILDVWKESLQRFGYRVATASDGEKAIRMYADGNFDIVILDVNMPGIGGLGFLERLRHVNPDAKVVISSGYSMNGLVRKALDMGAKAFLPKPYSIQRLARTIRRILDAPRSPMGATTNLPYGAAAMMGVEAA